MFLQGDKDYDIKCLTEILVYQLDEHNYVFSAESDGDNPHIYISHDRLKNEDISKIKDWVNNNLISKYPTYKCSFNKAKYGYIIRFESKN